MKQFISTLLVIVAVLGFLDASFITYEEVRGLVPPCGAGFSCGTVLDSPWASIGPIPLAMVGMFFYLLVLILASINLLEIDTSKTQHLLLNKLVPKQVSQKNLSLITKWTTPERLLILLTSFGFLFSIYLVSIMAFVIQAWCLYCLVSASTSSTLFLLAQYYRYKFL